MENIYDKCDDSLLTSWFVESLVLTYMCQEYKKTEIQDKTEKMIIFHPPFKITIFPAPPIHYGSTKRESTVIHTFAHLIVVSLISFLHIVRRNSMRIHHSDNRRKEERRRDEARRREVRGTLRMSEVGTKFWGGMRANKNRVCWSQYKYVPLHDTPFTDFEIANV